MTTRGRAGLLNTFDSYFRGAALDGYVVLGKRIRVGESWGVPGPRAGALEVSAGVDSGALLRALRASDYALLRQFIPWQFPGAPQAFMSGRYLRMEAAWPPELAETRIPLRSLGEHPLDGGRWVAGMSELGSTIRPGLTQATPHYLISGTTGSGKSTALHSIALQLSRDPLNKLVLIDGKYGSCLSSVSHLPGVMGPVATDLEAARNALGWAAGQMKARYQAADPAPGRVIVLVDEIQEFTRDVLFNELIRAIGVQGRGADTHLIVATHHPTVGLFGPKETKRQFLGRVCLLVSDRDASRVAVGAPRPRADLLSSGGDCYIVLPGGRVHRVQLAVVDQGDILKGGTAAHPLDGWPLYEPESLGCGLEEVGWKYAGAELAQAQIAAVQSPQEGRGKLNDRLKAAGLVSAGAEKGVRLLRLGRETVKALEEGGYGVACLPGHPISIPPRCGIVDVGE